MGMKALEDLRGMLCDELDEIAKKQEMSAGDLETVHKLTDTIKNIDKIHILEEDDGYSQAGDWEMEGRGSYSRESSYANRGKHYVRGHYSRGDGRMDNHDGYSGRGKSYNRDDTKDHMMRQLEAMMDDARNDREREAIWRCMEQMEKA